LIDSPMLNLVIFRLIPVSFSPMVKLELPGLYFGVEKSDAKTKLSIRHPV
jgi:hypothetical protein